MDIVDRLESTSLSDNDTRQLIISSTPKEHKFSPPRPHSMSSTDSEQELDMDNETEPLQHHSRSSPSNHTEDVNTTIAIPYRNKDGSITFQEHTESPPTDSPHQSTDGQKIDIPPTQSPTKLSEQLQQAMDDCSLMNPTLPPTEHTTSPPPQPPNASTAYRNKYGSITYPPEPSTPTPTTTDGQPPSSSESSPDRTQTYLTPPHDSGSSTSSPTANSAPFQSDTSQAKRSFVPKHSIRQRISDTSSAIGKTCFPNGTGFLCGALNTKEDGIPKKKKVKDEIIELLMGSGYEKHDVV